MTVRVAGSGASHASKHVRDRTYSGWVTAAFEFPSKDPFKLLAAAVIARWVEDQQRGLALDEQELGEEWAEMADVPRGWLEEAVA